MKRILFLATAVLIGWVAQAQNKIFRKYADMEGVEYICINKDLLNAAWSISISTADSSDVGSDGFPQLADYNRMLIINASGSKKQTLYNDVQSLAKSKDYETMMVSRSPEGSKAIFLYSDKVSPNEYIVCNLTPETCSVIVMLGDK